MYGVHPRIGKFQLAIGQSVRVSETRKSGDCIATFRTLLLNVSEGNHVLRQTRCGGDLKCPAEVGSGYREQSADDR